ncbi:tetratricopeptide repeat protein [Ferrovibrio sp.]|uniref:tetratricopeptide repeat protein n=1 Tax=Ferrovibrio sp. TaxID=1917215 RepID=UPI0035148022
MTDRRKQRIPRASRILCRPVAAGMAHAGLLVLLSAPVLSQAVLAQTAPQVNTPPAGISQPMERPIPPVPRVGQPPVPSVVPPSVPAVSAVRVRAGEHPTFTRLVFDWPTRVDYTAGAENGQAAIRFGSAVPLDLGRLPQFPPRWVSKLAARVEDGASRLDFAIPDGSALKTWRDGSKVVVDIGQPAEAAALAADKPAADKPAAEKPAAEKPAADRPAPAATPAQPAAAAAGRDAKPAMADRAAPPAAAAPAAAMPPAGTGAAATRPPAATPPAAPRPNAPPAAPAPGTAVTGTPAAGTPAPGAPAAAASPAAGQPAATVPAPAPLTAVQSAPLGTFMPAPPAGPIAGPPLVPAVDSSRTGPLLNFPWSRPVAAAAFLRNGHMWVVFDRPASVDLRPITTRDWGGAINGIEQLPVDGLTVLRIAVPGGTTASFTRRNAGWQVAINTIQPDQLVTREAAASEQNGDEAPRSDDGRREIDVRRQLDADGGSKLFFAANDPAAPLAVPDPDTGEILTIVPFAGANGGVPARRDFVELAVLPSYQGLAITPRADNLEIRRFPRGIEIGTPNGLALSSPRGANPQSGSTEILRYQDWRKVEGETYLEQEEDLLHRLAMATPGQRQAARMALAGFYASHEMMPEALGVLARARAEHPDLERDKLYRALRGIANLQLGRLNEASNDLDSRIFDDDPDILAYRGMLAAERDDWPSARRSFSLAGAAVAKFPPDLRTPIRLRMARAWLAGGDITAATAELAALGDDSMSRGEAAEGHYVRGLLAEATNKPEEAIRLFDQASGSGDRRARALAEAAKTELLLARKLIKPEQAIEQLDRLRFAWRGGPYEFNLLRRLGELEFSVGDLRAGITTFRELVKYFPKSPEIPLLTKQMSDEFSKLFLDGGAQALPPLTALGLYYDYRELTPAGPEGDEIIDKLADRLVSVDLLNRAAELLEHQITYRLRGEQRSKAGARLAIVYLLDHNPDAALKSLQNTQSPNLSPALVQERRLLEARALADLDRFAESLNLLGSDQSPPAMELRADIHWRAKDWLAFARVVSQVLGNRHADPAPLTTDERRQVLKLAVAYSLSNDVPALTDLRRRYDPKFRDTPDAATFNAVASTITRDSGDPRELAAAIAQIGQYEAFMDRYRERVARGGLSAIN